MANSMYIGLSRQMALKTDMAIIANNVANMNTVGYRGQNLLFEEFISKPKGMKDDMSFVYDRGQYQATTPGAVEETGNPLDIALNGPGFIAIDAGQENPTYTRAGNFRKDIDGTLVTQDGNTVLGEGGPIVFPEDTTEIKIDEKGVVSNQSGEIGQIQIVEFENLQDLDPLGNNLYTTEAQPQPAQETVTHQGYLEGSNVNGVTEMARMIETLRSYQSINNSITNEHDRLKDAIQKLSKVS